MNCIIIDDDNACRTALEQLIKQVNYLNLVGMYSGPVEAMNALKTDTADLAFLDVEMPEMTGMEMLKNIKMPSTILTTSHEKYASEAFEHNSIVDYLVKPFTLPRFIKAVERVKTMHDKQNSEVEKVEKDYFFIKKASVHTKVPTKDILWIESLGDYLTIHTVKDKYILHLTLKAIETKLPTDKFVRVHRSYIVHIDNISTVEDTTIFVNNVSIPIGALYKENFQKKISVL